jgi:hypothetical protein
MGSEVGENKLHKRPVCIYCLQEIGLGVPRHWHGLGAYSHRECYEAAGELAPQQDARRRP